MRIELAPLPKSLPLPATSTWPEGVWDIEALRHGSMSVELFTPRGVDHQTSHEQDELYVVMAGTGVLLLADVPHLRRATASGSERVFGAVLIKPRRAA